MALRWGIEDIENFSEVCYSQTEETDEHGEPLYRLMPKTEALIWMTMSVGINKITDENAAEFFARTAVVEKYQGASCFKMMQSKRVADQITPEDVRGHVGLWTNAAAKTRAQFLKEMFGQPLDYHSRRYTDRFGKEVTASAAEH